jgi:diguanylate cyclase (GGDEF)-like protein
MTTTAIVITAVISTLAASTALFIWAFIAYYRATAYLSTDLIIALNELHTTRQRLHDVQYEANHDELTALPNRRATLAQLAYALDNSEPVSMAILDIDRFKDINDAYGHHAGDEALRHVAAALSQAVGTTHHIGRLAGDEFAIVVEGGMFAALHAAHLAVQQIHTTLLGINDQTIAVRVSVGVAVADDTRDPIELQKRADHALYHAKHPTGSPIVGWLPGMTMPAPPSYSPQRRTFRI